MFVNSRVLVMFTCGSSHVIYLELEAHAGIRSIYTKQVISGCVINAIHIYSTSRHINVHNTQHHIAIQGCTHYLSSNNGSDPEFHDINSRNMVDHLRYYKL